MRQQHRAGEKLFADFAGQTMPILGHDGGAAFQAHIFVAVLGASNYTYACATCSKTTPDWIGGLIDAMEFYGGVFELLVPDNPTGLDQQAVLPIQLTEWQAPDHENICGPDYYH
jgi:transposase